MRLRVADYCVSVNYCLIHHNVFLMKCGLAVFCMRWVGDRDPEAGSLGELDVVICNSSSSGLAANNGLFLAVPGLLDGLLVDLSQLGSHYPLPWCCTGPDWALHGGPKLRLIWPPSFLAPDRNRCISKTGRGTGGFPVPHSARSYPIAEIVFNFALHGGLFLY